VAVEITEDRMSDQAEVDDFLMLCAELSVEGTRRRGLLWHSLCRARAIGAQQVLVSLRGLITTGHPKEFRPLRVHEVLMAVKMHQEQTRRDQARWHDLPEKYRQAEPVDYRATQGYQAGREFAQHILKQLAADIEAAPIRTPRPPAAEHSDTCMCQECMPTAVVEDQQEGAGDGTGETPAIPDGNESTAPETGGAEAGECGGRDDVG
jgi:hypothetical protein